MDELIDRKKLSAVMTEVGLDMTRGAGSAPTSSIYFQPVTNGHTETPSRLSRVLPRTLPGKNPCYVPWRQWWVRKPGLQLRDPHLLHINNRITAGIQQTIYHLTLTLLPLRWCLDKIRQKHAKCMIKIRYFRLFLLLAFTVFVFRETQC